MVVIAHVPDDFSRWFQARQAVALAPKPAGDGFGLFSESGCAACHAIDGTDAVGRTGPNLTNVASRETIGAGIMPNNRGTMTAWVGHSQSIKPGNRMPNYDRLEPGELHAIVSYLETLK
jgi:cytochrome c oxidase subunit 2